MEYPKDVWYYLKDLQTSLHYLIIPKGITSHLMNRLFHHLPFVFVYLNDILIGSTTPTTHLQHIHQVFTIPADNNLQVKPSKCSFTQSSIDFLGHFVSPSGLKPLPCHVDTILQFPPPSTVKDLQCFLGLMNLYHRSVPHAASILQPLSNALTGSPKTFAWSPECAVTFHHARSALAAAVPLDHPAPQPPLLCH